MTPLAAMSLNAFSIRVWSIQSGTSQCSLGMSSAEILVFLIDPSMSRTDPLTVCTWCVCLRLCLIFEFLGEWDVIKKDPGIVETRIERLFHISHRRDNTAKLRVADERDERGICARGGFGVCRRRLFHSCKGILQVSPNNSYSRSEGLVACACEECRMRGIAKKMVAE